MTENSIELAVICTTLLILLLIAIIMIVFFVSGKQRVKQQMLLAETKFNFERELRKAETEVSEEVMGKFAQELHDNIGQLLTAMHIQIENQKLDFPDLVVGFKPVELYLGEARQQLRTLSRTLNNDYIGHIGLLSAIHLETERLKGLRKFQVHLEPISGKSNLTKNQELMVFRIFQETIQNSLRHSSAKNFNITINNDKDGFELAVSDDGKGFEYEQIIMSNKASGLRNIIKRANLAELKCRLESSPGMGCVITLKKIPGTEIHT